jgi:hypothetical protein
VEHGCGFPGGGHYGQLFEEGLDQDMMRCVIPAQNTG